MKHIKKYETFDFSKTLPITSMSELTFYYYCDDCDSLWKSLNKQNNVCKFCKSKNIEDLSIDEWYSMQENIGKEDEVGNTKSQRKEDESTFVNLLSFHNKDNNRNVD